MKTNRAKSIQWQKQILEPVSRSWTTRRDEKRRRIELVKPWMRGSILPQEKIIDALETLIVSGDRIVLEGDHQKQADFLSRSLVKVDAKRRPCRSFATADEGLSPRSSAQF